MPLIKNQIGTAVFGAVLFKTCAISLIIDFLKFVTTISFDALITLTLLSMTCNILFTIFLQSLLREAAEKVAKLFAAYHTEIAIYPIRHGKALNVNL